MTDTTQTEAAISVSDYVHTDIDAIISIMLECDTARCRSYVSECLASELAFLAKLDFDHEVLGNLFTPELSRHMHDYFVARNQRRRSGDDPANEYMPLLHLGLMLAKVFERQMNDRISTFIENHPERYPESQL